MIFEIPFFSRVSDNWLISRTAGILFAVSCLLVIVITPIMFGYVTVPDTARGEVVAGLLGVAGTFSIFFLWLGMWRYWVRLDDSKTAAKRLSFVVLLLGLWYGAILYFLLRYIWLDDRMQWCREARDGDETVASTKDRDGSAKAGVQIRVFRYSLIICWSAFLGTVLLCFLFPKTMGRALGPAPAFFVLVPIVLLVGAAIYGVIRLYCAGMKRVPHPK